MPNQQRDLELSIAFDEYINNPALKKAIESTVKYLSEHGVNNVNPQQTRNDIMSAFGNLNDLTNQFNENSTNELMKTLNSYNVTTEELGQLNDLMVAQMLNEVKNNIKSREGELKAPIDDINNSINAFMPANRNRGGLSSSKYHLTPVANMVKSQDDYINSLDFDTAMNPENKIENDDLLSKIIAFSNPPAPTPITLQMHSSTYRINPSPDREIEDKVLNQLDKRLDKQVMLLSEYDVLSEQKINELNQKNNDFERDLKNLTPEFEQAQKNMKNAESIHQGNLREIKNNEKILKDSQDKLSKMGLFSKIFSQKAKDLRSRIVDAKTEIKEFTKLLPQSQKEMSSSKNDFEKCATRSNEIKIQKEENSKIINQYQQIQDKTKLIKDNSVIMKELTRDIDVKNSEIINITNSLKSKQNELKNTPKGDERDKLLKEISDVMDSKNGLIKEHDDLKNKYSDLNNEVEKCNDFIVKAQKGINNIYQASSGINDALKTSNNVVEKGRETLEVAKGVFFKMAGAALSLINKDVGDLVKNVGGQTIDDAKNAYSNWKQHKQETKEMDNIVKKVDKNDLSIS